VKRAKKKKRRSTSVREEKINYRNAINPEKKKSAGSEDFYTSGEGRTNSRLWGERKKTGQPIINPLWKMKRHQHPALEGDGD